MFNKSIACAKQWNAFRGRDRRGARRVKKGMDVKKKWGGCEVVASETPKTGGSFFFGAFVISF